MSAPPPLPGSLTFGFAGSPTYDVFRLPKRSTSAPPMKPRSTCPCAISAIAFDIRIAHRAEEARRGLVAHETHLEKPSGARCVRVAGNGVSEDWQPHPDEHEVAVADLARGHSHHQLLRGVRLTHRRSQPARRTGDDECAATRHPRA